MRLLLQKLMFITSTAGESSDADRTKPSICNQCSSAFVSGAILGHIPVFLVGDSSSSVNLKYQFMEID